MASFRQLTIHFETSAQLPPPYSYQYELRLKPSFQFLHAQLKLSYTHREELDMDEIEAEGFTPNDDYEWEGNLEKVWRDEVEKLLNKTKVDKNKQPDEEADLLALAWESDQTIEGTPQNLEDWYYLAQELLQAIYETSGKERAFELHLLDITSQEVKESILTASFQTRTAQIKKISGGKSALRFYPWYELPHLMEVLYAPNWLSEGAHEQRPKRNGLYFSPGDGIWYEYGKQIVEPGKGAATLSKLKQFVNRLLS